ncbi:hypothetical protein [Streptomyces sp. HPF1205]|uniref:hypothetical protein n=1 Tax=Streptomyces sp. HPF1205 TaxID=2873262 RepID=UPI001CEC8149|nr:hypothetical protein [Streptomyces sp. HPF1205]
MYSAAAARRAAPVLLTAVLLTACSSGHGHTTSAASAGGPSPAAPTHSASRAPASPDYSPTTSPSATSDYPISRSAPGAPVAQVRDAFAVLQATYNDGCTTPGNCEYFLTRVLTNLDDLYDSMKASPKGSGHFAQPLTWIQAMRHGLHGDYSFPNLKRHQKTLLGTRDKINTWMQSHPDDYR